MMLVKRKVCGAERRCGRRSRNRIKHTTVRPQQIFKKQLFHIKYHSNNFYLLFLLLSFLEKDLKVSYMYMDQFYFLNC